MILSQQCVLVRNMRIFHKHQNIPVVLELSQWPFSAPAGWVITLFPFKIWACPYYTHCLWPRKNVTGVFWISSLSWKKMVPPSSSVSHGRDTLSRSLSRGENSQDSYPWNRYSLATTIPLTEAITHKAEGQYNGVGRFLMSFPSLQGRSQSAPQLHQCCFDES